MTEVATSRNVRCALATYDAWNRRDFDAEVALYGEDCIWTDHARGLVFKGRDQIRAEYLEGWSKGFSDGHIADLKVCDGGDTVVVQFIGRGTHDGPLGPLPATGREVTLPYVEVLHFDSDGRIVAGEAYYDQVTLLSQLGVMDAPG